MEVRPSDDVDFLKNGSATTEAIGEEREDNEPTRELAILVLTYRLDILGSWICETFTRSDEVVGKEEYAELDFQMDPGEKKEGLDFYWSTWVPR